MTSHDHAFATELNELISNGVEIPQNRIPSDASTDELTTARQELADATVTLITKILTGEATPKIEMQRSGLYIDGRTAANYILFESRRKGYAPTLHDLYRRSVK